MWMELPGWRFLEMDSVIFILQSGEMHSWFKNAAKEMFIQMSPFRLVGIFGSSTSSTHLHLRQKISRFWSIDISEHCYIRYSYNFGQNNRFIRTSVILYHPFDEFIFSNLHPGQNKKLSKISIFWTFERKISKLCWSNKTTEFDVVNRDGTNSNWFCKSVLLQRSIYFFTYQNHPLTHWFRG